MRRRRSTSAYGSTPYLTFEELAALPREELKAYLRQHGGRDVRLHIPYLVTHLHALERLARAEATRVLGSRTADVDQVVGDALFQALFAGRTIANVEGWIRTVARRRAIDILRTRTRYQLLDLDTNLHTLLTDLAVNIDGLDLREAVESIPSKQREVILLHYYADLPYAEIAELTKTPTNTVKSHAIRGLAELRERLGQTR